MSHLQRVLRAGLNVSTGNTPPTIPENTRESVIKKLNVIRDELDTQISQVAIIMSPVEAKILYGRVLQCPPLTRFFLSRVGHDLFDVLDLIEQLMSGLENEEVSKQSNAQEAVNKEVERKRRELIFENARDESEKLRESISGFE